MVTRSRPHASCSIRRARRRSRLDSPTRPAPRWTVPVALAPRLAYPPRSATAMGAPLQLDSGPASELLIYLAPGGTGEHRRSSTSQASGLAIGHRAALVPRNADPPRTTTARHDGARATARPPASPRTRQRRSTRYTTSRSPSRLRPVLHDRDGRHRPSSRARIQPGSWARIGQMLQGHPFTDGFRPGPHHYPRTNGSSRYHRHTGAGTTNQPQVHQDMGSGKATPTEQPHPRHTYTLPLTDGNTPSRPRPVLGDRGGRHRSSSTTGPASEPLIDFALGGTDGYGRSPTSPASGSAVGYNNSRA
jgi:hypothetical protein